MAITGNSSYIPTLNQFLAHWGQCNVALAPAALLIQKPNNTTVTRAQFTTQRDAQQMTEQTAADHGIYSASGMREEARLQACSSAATSRDPGACYGPRRGRR